MGVLRCNTPMLPVPWSPEHQSVKLHSVESNPAGDRPVKTSRSDQRTDPRNWIRRCTGWLAALGLCGSAWAAAPTGMVAILDGDAQLVRQATRYKLEEGAPLLNEDIVETGEQARIVRIELQNGAMFDLGPATRVMIAPPLPSSRSKVAAQLYLLQGWVKWTAGKLPGAVLSSPMDVQGSARSVVLALTRNNVQAFAEAGEWTLIERGNGGTGSAPATTASMMLRQEQFYLREGLHKGRLLERPTPDFLKEVPRAFIDSLPPRMNKIAKSNVVPKLVAGIAYADVQPWIDAEPALRKHFVTRWRAKASEPEFRKGLQAGMAAHPEWDRIVNPEKYLPKPQSQLVLP
jgi:hypothetical protein